jgi:hypothetical protein
MEHAEGRGSGGTGHWICVLLTTTSLRRHSSARVINDRVKGGAYRSSFKFVRRQHVRERTYKYQLVRGPTQLRELARYDASNSNL